MTASCFVDTNILVYSRDASEPAKQPRAIEWLGQLWGSRKGRVSMQVLSEYFVTVTQKLEPGLAPKRAWQDVSDLFAWRPVTIDRPLLEQARAVQLRFGLSWWDCLIVAAAKASACEYLLTEDLQDQQDLDGLVVLDPFLHGLDEVTR